MCIINVDEIKLEAKIELLKSLIKSSKESIKIAKLNLEGAKSDYRAFGGYSDCGESYKSDLLEAELKLKYEISTKIKLEKTCKFYRYSLIELSESVEII